MNWEEMKNRYLEDAEFHTLVDAVYNMLYKGQVSIYELKDAVTFAVNKFVMEQGLMLYNRRKR